jgi:DNA-binding NtrC family response regulator
MHGLPISECRGNQRMPDSTILTVTSDQDFVALLRQQLRGHAGSGGPMIVARTIDEACSLVKTVRPRLVVAHWTRDGSRYEQLDRLLWTTSVLARKVPVLVIAERYRTDQATMMFRMGVTEYISRTHHIDQLGQVFAAYLPPTAAVSRSAEAIAAIASKAWPTNQPAQSISAHAV